MRRAQGQKLIVTQIVEAVNRCFITPASSRSRFIAGPLIKVWNDHLFFFSISGKIIKLVLI